MMSASRRRSGAPVFALLLAIVGCASFEGARLYESGTAALDRGEPQRAVVDLERAAALVPQASEIQNHLGLAYAAAGRPEDAERAFRRAVELDCQNTAARDNLRAAELRGAVAKP
jgi:Flp pilus assembly protein TadD